MHLSASNSIKITAGLVAAVAAYFVVSAFAHAEAAPVVANQIQNTSNAAITTALIGASVHDVVEVSSSTTAAIPQGTVDFSVYSNTSCAGAAASTQTGVALVNGFATSTASTVPAGGLSYLVHYSGDNSNIASNSQCVSVTASSNTSALALTLSTTTTVLAGSSVHVSAALSNVTSNATGTVAYSVYSNAACTTGVQAAGTRAVTNGAATDSDNVIFNTPGTYYWRAVYSGDQNNSAATSSCANALTVQAVSSGKNSPTITTSISSSSVQIGTSVTASAALAGATATASGTVSYKVYSDSACSSLWANAGSQSVTNAVVPNAAPVLFNSAGTYYWQTVYGGDQNNNAATSSCASALAVSANGTPVPTGPGTISGQVFNDANKNGVKDSGENGLAGFKINLYNSPNFNNGTYAPVYKTVITDGSGNYSFTGLSDGTYSVEQLKKTGWKQNSDDFPTVVVSSGAGKAGLNFADVAKKNKNDGRDNGKHKKDCRDADDREHASTSTPNNWRWNKPTTTSTTTPGWFKFEGNKGLHLGWMIGKGNHKKGRDH